MTTILALLLVGFVATGPILSQVEHPDYTLIEKEKNFEIRSYQPQLVAEVHTEGERREAIGDGFRLLADYIFGNNIKATKIDMTAPVQQTASEKISMTAPVQQTAFNQGWKVQFVMPSEYTLQTIPKPKNEKVKLVEVPAKKFVVIRFSGMNNTKNVEKHEAKLLDYVQQKKLQIKGPALYAFYNPPVTLPPLRRNEVMFEIE